MQDLLPWFSPVVALSALLYAIFSNRSKARDQRVDEIASGCTALAERIDKLEDRTTKIEGEIRHAPTKDDFTDLRITVTQLAGKVETLTESLKPVTAMAGRIQEALIEKVTG